MLYTFQKFQELNAMLCLFGKLIRADNNFLLNNLLITETNILMSKTESDAKLFANMPPWKPRVICVLQNNGVPLQVYNLCF
jgi:hypothetical protein